MRGGKSQTDPQAEESELAVEWEVSAAFVSTGGLFLSLPSPARPFSVPLPFPFPSHGLAWGLCMMPGEDSVLMGWLGDGKVWTAFTVGV